MIRLCMIPKSSTLKLLLSSHDTCELKKHVKALMDRKVDAPTTTFMRPQVGWQPKDKYTIKFNVDIVYIILQMTAHNTHLSTMNASD